MPRILIIDDEPEILDLVRMILEGEGHEICCCPSGRQAWDSITTQNPDLVILDIMLPGVDGYSLQLQMAQEESTRQVPVLILTALEPARTLFVNAPNVVGFISKPFRSENLMVKVREILGRTEVIEAVSEAKACSV